MQANNFVTTASSPYILPFAPGTRHVVWRTTSHFTPGNGGVGLYAIDFGMPVGIPILAARSGKVVATQGRFPDGTVARYIHLQRDGVLVKIGDVVAQGQRIALSGNTGQTGGPHLHFDVQRCGPNLPPQYNKLPCGMTLPISFRNTSAQRCGLEAGRRYRAQHPC